MSAVEEIRGIKREVPVRGPRRQRPVAAIETDLHFADEHIVGGGAGDVQQPGHLRRRTDENGWRRRIARRGRRCDEVRFERRVECITRDRIDRIGRDSHPVGRQAGKTSTPGGERHRIVYCRPRE